MMTDKRQRYAVDVTWTGNQGSGTSSYRDYSRDHEVRIDSKPDQVLLGSADGAFRGDTSRYNPEELLLTALSQCHMLSYFHACVLAGITVVAYSDHATATMVTSADGSGHFTEVTLHPQVVVATGTDLAAAAAAHDRAHRMCFIANSVNFPVGHQPSIRSATP